MSERFRRRHLPHWDVPGATYFVTACLAGSIPAQGLLDLQRLEQKLAGRQRPPHLTEREWQTHKWKLAFARQDHWLDTRPAVRHFDNQQLAAELQQSLYYFAAERYDLLAYVIMPSHFHWVFRPLESWVATLADPANDRTPRERIMHSIKRHTALACNRLLGIAGAFWQDESYDHVVQDEEELARIVAYMELNPVQAGLVARADMWRYSSAHDRAVGQVFNLSPLTKADLQRVCERDAGA